MDDTVIAGSLCFSEMPVGLSVMDVLNDFGGERG